MFEMTRNELLTVSGGDRVPDMPDWVWLVSPAVALVWTGLEVGEALDG